MTIESYDAAGKSIAVKHTKGKPNKFFPKPEGAPSDTTKIPKKCKKKQREDSYAVKSSGGRMSVTQFRTNFEGKMLNDTESDEWFATKMKELIDGKTEVALVIRPGMKKGSPLEITTIYMPANEADYAEIKRLEDQAEDL